MFNTTSDSKSSLGGCRGELPGKSLSDVMAASWLAGLDWTETKIAVMQLMVVQKNANFFPEDLVFFSPQIFAFRDGLCVLGRHNGISQDSL